MKSIKNECDKLTRINEKLKRRIKLAESENTQLKTAIEALIEMDLDITKTGLIEHSQRLKDICQLWDVRLPELFLPIRTRLAASEARQVVMFALSHESRLSYEKIGEYLGGRDHSTVTHSIKKVNELATVDKSYRNKLTALNLDKWLITK